MYEPSLAARLLQEWYVTLSDEQVRSLLEEGVDEDEDEEVKHNLINDDYNKLKTILLNKDIRKLDLRHFTIAPAAMGTVEIVNPIFLQLINIVDISIPPRLAKSGETASNNRRLLRMVLTDGREKLSAIEIEYCKTLNTSIPPGTKLLILPSPRNPLMMRNGVLLLRSHNFKVLGGEVRRLIDNWKASKDVHLLRSAGGSKHCHDDADGAPKFKSFPLGLTSFSHHASSSQPSHSIPSLHESINLESVRPASAVRCHLPEIDKPELINQKQKTKIDAFQTKLKSHSDCSHRISRGKRSRGRGRQHEDESSYYLVSNERPKGTVADVFNEVSLASSRKVQSSAMTEEFPSLDPCTFSSSPTFPSQVPKYPLQVPKYPLQVPILNSPQSSQTSLTTPSNPSRTGKGSNYHSENRGRGRGRGRGFFHRGRD